MRCLTALALWLAAAFGAGACEDDSYQDIGGEIRILASRNDALVPPATLRLARFGRRAIPQIEIALHTASPTGKAHLVHALERIGDAEAIPVLRHFAAYDPVPEVRAACGDVLERWAWTRDARGEAARRARARIADKRASVE